jgi:hypothetical protein
MTDVPVDPGVVHRTPVVEGLTEGEEEELRAELAKVLWFYFLSRDDHESFWVIQRVEHSICSDRAVAGLLLAFCVYWAISLYVPISKK